MLFRNFFALLTILLYQSINLIECKRPFLLLFQEIQCPSHSNITAFLNCSLTQLASHESAITVNFKNAPKIFVPKMNFSITARRNGQKKSDRFIDLTDLDVCQFLAGQSKFTILRLTQKGLLEVSKIPTECPIEEGFESNIRSYVFSTENLPLYVPEMAIEVSLQFMEKSVKAFDVVLKGKIIPRNPNAKRRFTVSRI